MTSKLNKLLLLLLAAALIFSLATATALAADYPVWVGSTQVTSSNMNDVLGDGKVSYAPASHTLTLNDVTVANSQSGKSVCIYSDGQDLTIKGKVTVSGQQVGIFAAGAKLTIAGDVTSTDAAYYGLLADDIVIESGTVKVIDSYYTAIYAENGNVTISGDTTQVTANSKEAYSAANAAIAASGSVTISGGVVKATSVGSDSAGILAKSGNITVSGDSTEVTAKGDQYGIYAKTGITVNAPLSVVTPEDGAVNKIEDVGFSYYTIEDDDGVFAAEVVIKKAGSTTATYTLKGLTASGTGYSYISMMNSVIPIFSDKTPVWGGADPGTSAIRYTDSAFFTDASETTALKVAPVEGETYYFYFTISNNIENDHSIDFSKVDSAQVNVTLSGFTVEYLNAETEVQAGCDSVLLHFRATKDATPAATHTVTVNNGKAYDGPGAAGQVITKAAEGDKVYVRFPDITIPEGKYVAGYTSEQVGQQRYDELTDGIVLNFTMPAKDVVLDAILEDQTDLVVDLTDGTEAYASGPFSLLYNSLYSAAGQGLIDLDDSGSQRLVDLDKDSNNDIIINGADEAIDLHSECNIKGELTVLNINYGAYKSITFKFKMFDGDLPVVNGATINFTDVTKDGDSYKLNTDGAEKAIFADSAKTASITFEVNPLYEDQAMTTKLTAAPESGVPVYFIVGLEAYEDKDPLEPTVEWAANATIMAQSQLTAENGEIEIVEISHSPAGGTLSLICKYTAAAPATYTVTYKVVNGTWSDGTKDEITETVAEGEKPANVPTGMKAASGYSDGKWDTDPDSAAISEDTTFTYTFTKKSSGGSSGGSGSGGNSSSAAKEEVNVADSENGDVSVDPEEAKKGQTVTVTAEPDPGYEVDEVKVTDEDGKEVPVTDNGDGTYSFKMPDGPVDVAVTFKDKDGFSDVGPNDWFYDEVLYAVDNGLMNGVGGDLFAPNDPTTRAMIVTILYRLEGSPAVSEAAPFSDVAAGQWYADAVAWASANDIVKGFPDGTFKPDELITREQFVTILYRYAQFKGYDVSVGEDTNILSFNDALEVSDWANAAVCWAVGAGLMQGDDQGNLNPQAPASRAEAAALFQRFAEKVK